MSSAQANRRYRRQAQVAANLTYGPQEAGLRELVRQARADYLLGLSQANAAARGQQLAIRNARPQIGATYAHAQGELQAGQNLLAQDFQKLGAGADPFRGASAREAAAAARRVEQARTDALNELAQQGIDASSGQMYQQQNLRGQYRSDIDKLARQAQDIEGQKGLAAQKLFGDLIDKSDQRRLTRRGQNLTYKAAHQRAAETHRHNVATERNARRNGGLSPAEVRARRKATAEAQDAISEAQSWIGRLKKSMSEHEIRAGLLTGQTLVDANSNKLKLPKIPKAYVNAAYDLATFGRLSQPNVHALRIRGIHVQPSWLPRPVTSLNFGPLGSIPLPKG